MLGLGEELRQRVLAAQTAWGARVAHFGHRDHSDRWIVISEIGQS